MKAISKLIVAKISRYLALSNIIVPVAERPEHEQIVYDELCEHFKRSEPKEKIGVVISGKDPPPIEIPPKDFVQ